MKRKLIIISLLSAVVTTMAETSLVIRPLTGNERGYALAQIGYVKVTPDSLFVYSHAHIMLSKEAFKNIHHIRYGEQNVITTIDETQTTMICRVYPNPTQDMLIIDNAGCEKAYIFDFNGSLLQTVHIDGEHTSINVTKLPQGNYLLLLNDQIFKFIKL